MQTMLFLDRVGQPKNREHVLPLFPNIFSRKTMIVSHSIPNMKVVLFLLIRSKKAVRLVSGGVIMLI